MIYRGRELTATMTATFHANRTDITKDKSAKRILALSKQAVVLRRTKVFRQECHANNIKEQCNNFRSHHVHMPRKSYVSLGSRAFLTTTYQVVISKATMINSFRMRAVKEIATMLRNSFSNNRRDMTIIAPPEFQMDEQAQHLGGVAGGTNPGIH
jgi:hypothetical protein